MYGTKKMAENLKEKQEKKGVFSKIKENIDDKEEQMAFLGTIIQTWSNGMGRIYNFFELHHITWYH